MMSAYVLPDIMLRLCGIPPRLRIDVVAANDIRDLLKREAGIASRHVCPEQSDPIARLVREATGHLYAFKQYIAARGAPKTVEDLKNMISSVLATTCGWSKPSRVKA